MAIFSFAAGDEEAAAALPDFVQGVAQLLAAVVVVARMNDAHGGVVANDKRCLWIESRFFHKGSGMADGDGPAACKLGQALKDFLRRKGALVGVVRCQFKGDRPVEALLRFLGQAEVPIV